MNVNEDKVPTTLEEAVQILIDAVTPQDKKDIDAMLKKEKGLQLINAHDTFGRWLRNAWSLWEDTPLVRWFVNTHNLCHADDISAIILEAFAAKYVGNPYNPTWTVNHFHEHWKKQLERDDAPEFMLAEWNKCHKHGTNDLDQPR